MARQRLEEQYLKELGHRIRLVRTSLKIDQARLAEVLKTGQAHVSRLEIGKSPPTLFQLFTIKELADSNERIQGRLTWEWLLEGKGPGFL